MEITHSHFVALLLRNVIDFYEGSTRYRTSPLRMARASQAWATAIFHNKIFLYKKAGSRFGKMLILYFLTLCVLRFLREGLDLKI